MYKDLQTSIWGWTKADTDDRSNVKKEVSSAGDRKRTALKPLAEWNFFLFNFDFFTLLQKEYDFVFIVLKI